MIGPNNFKDEDKDNLIKFLNMLNKHARLDLSITETIEFYKLLAWSQQVLSKKIEANIIGEPKITEPKKKSK